MNSYEVTQNVAQSEAQPSNAQVPLALFNGMVGQSAIMQELFSLIRHIAPTDAPIFIHGETGTGKELVARAIHQLSTRCHGPFIPVNCAAIAKELFESEMFGHEKGSFTGAVDHKIGAFEAANHGTLFLDEIGELSLEQQSKLLRALEALTIQRVGSSRQIPLNIRIISATNRNLEEEISANHFRSDLFYRIYVVPINLPPLRFRPDDIPSLAEHFLSLYCQKYWGAKKMTISPPAIESLQRRRWPGNIRELRNVMERAIITCQQPMLTRKDVEGACYRLDFDYFACDQENRFGKVKEMERDLILKELERNNWNKQLTARTLGMAKSTLFEKIKKYEIRLNRDSQYCPDQLNG